MALAVATRYRRVVVAAPANLCSQWRSVAGQLAVTCTLVSHESLSRGGTVPRGDLVVVDEAHRFRNPKTRRYTRLAQGVRSAPVLLLTATPVVNGASDLAHLLRTFLPDHGLALLGTPSLQAAVRSRAYDAIFCSASTLIVARSHDVLEPSWTRLPRPVDAAIVRLGPLPSQALQAVLSAVDALEFPAAGESVTQHLLRLHLLHRLSSSVVAGRQTLRRHLAYLDRAQTAARSGERLSRAAARRIFGPGDDMQLTLGLPALHRPPQQADEAALRTERERLLQLLACLPHAIHPNPKADRLTQILRSRAGAKTIVFTTAVATALDLARRLAWREVAVVGGGRAWIASSSVSVDVALRLFAPHARRAAEPPAGRRVATLIATDLVSEGLDLQDADGIVHYDLPWTPLRLSQRLGRVARLGSAHRTARVWWMLPPSAVEQRLRLTERLVVKAARQLRLGVPVTSVPGRGHLLNLQLEHRERLWSSRGPRGADPGGQDTPGPAHGPRVAVARGPLAVAAAARWCLGGSTVPHLLVLEGADPKAVLDHRRVLQLVHALLHGEPSQHSAPDTLTQALLDTWRASIHAAQLGPHDAETRRLRRMLLRRGADAAKARDRRALDLLSTALDHVSAGLRVGALSALSERLILGSSTAPLAQWIAQLPPGERSIPRLTVDAVIFGDGQAG